MKALAGQLTPDNREACAQTTKPLVEAVEALTTFASSPEFASTPAKISAQVNIISNHDYCDVSKTVRLIKLKSQSYQLGRELLKPVLVY